MMKKIKYIIPLALITILGSCKKDFFDINTDPNNPTDAPINLLLPTAQRTLGDALAMGGSGENGGLSQELSTYVHHISTREEADQYGITGQNFYTNLAWPKFYASSPPPGESAPLYGILQNLEEIIAKSTEDENLWYRGIAKVLKAYSYSQLVDVFGDIPFSQANKLNDATNPVIYPTFDDDAAIYSQLFVMIDEAIADLGTSEQSNALIPADDDLIYGGNIANWIKAANTLKLKLYTQTRLVDDVSAEVSALLAAPESLINSIDESFMLPYGTLGATDDRNPGFGEYFAPQRSNHISPWFYETLMGRNAFIHTGIKDPRIPYYWYNQLTPDEAPQNQTEYRDHSFATIYFGSVGPDKDRSNQVSLSVVGIYPVGGRYDDSAGITVSGTSGTGAAPYRFITYPDRLFLEAELINAGVATGDEKAVLRAAIEASFEQVDQVIGMVAPTQTVPLMSSAEVAPTVTDYIDDVMAEYDANPAKHLQIIMTQKWIQTFGSEVDPYTDYRRTGFPIIWDPSNETMAPGGFAQPPVDGDPFQDVQKKVPVLIGRDFPYSLPWPRSEIEVNVNAPAQKTPSDPSAKIFWKP
jgi:hypothetical protein